MIQTRSRILRMALLVALPALGENPEYIAKLRTLGFPSLGGQIPTYYSPAYRSHAQKLKAMAEDMNAFFKAQMGVEARFVWAVLDSHDWTKVTGSPWGFPGPQFGGGNPQVIFMPATSGSPVFGLMMARKEAIPPEQLDAFLKGHHTTFEAVADQFVDLLGFHEVGHDLTLNFGIDPKVHWLHEFLASYWAYAYIAERKPEWKGVFALLGRPSKVRPKNTSLEDLERLYSGVDDYGWYQGMFEVHIREMYPEYGLKFLRAIREALPRSPDSPALTPRQVLERVEKIAPGFEKWAEGFRPAN
jgi:hypothetical protein